MASLVTYDGGLRRIEFTMDKGGRRQVIRLGRMRKTAAKAVKARVEQIIGDRVAGRPHDVELSRWLSEADEKLLSRLRAVGLAEGVGTADATLGDFLERYFGTMDVKPSTRRFYGHIRRNLIEHFGAGAMLRSIGPGEADGWRSWLANHEGLAQATVARRVIAARTFWRKASRWKLVRENPFEGIKTGSQSNEHRKRFVPAATIERVIEAAPDAEWRAIIALARYGGLRCPSEILPLTWADVDWDRGTLFVRSPKTEHHAGGDSRLVPLFPELRRRLLDAFEVADDGARYVITRYRDITQNLNTQFRRIIKSAGLKVWPKPFHNLRASRETELMRDYDLATVCKWIGNSPAVAAKHYAMSVDLDADFARAVSGPEAQQKAQQSASAGGGGPLTETDGGNEKNRPDGGSDGLRQAEATVGEADQWAIQDSNL